MSEEKNQPVSNQSPTVITGVTDRAAEFAQQQEQKRLDFEDKQERKRQDFETKLEKQKATREWLMLIITVVAVAAAAWTAYEARQARIDAQETMHLDERAYLKLTIKDVKALDATKDRFVTARFMLTTYGRTAALNILPYQQCDLSTQFIVPPLPTTPEIGRKPLFSMIPPGDSNELLCMIELDKQQGWVFRYYGTVFYQDIFGSSHMTQFCWRVIERPKQEPEVGPCTNVELKIT